MLTDPDVNGNRQEIPQRWRTGKSLNKAWKKAVAAAGFDVRERTAYNLRHSYASRAIAAGVPVNFVAGQLGLGTEPDAFVRP